MSDAHPPAGPNAGLVEEAVDYALRYGGMCRQCADEDGICPNSGLPCEAPAAERVIRRILDAVGYGIAHGYIQSPFALASTPPAPSEEAPIVQARALVVRCLGYFGQTASPDLVEAAALKIVDGLPKSRTGRLADSTPPSAVPAGWVLVPREPTVYMRDAGMKAQYAPSASGTIYRAMLAAAPPPPDTTKGS